MLVKISKAMAKEFECLEKLGDGSDYPEKAGEHEINEMTAVRMLGFIKEILKDLNNPALRTAYLSLKKQLENGGSVSQRNTDTEFIWLNPDEIVIEDQVRTEFNEESIRELAEDIKANGQIQPVTVRQSVKAESWILVAGERRVRACLLAGLKVLVRVIQADKSKARRIQIAENVQREDLSLMEKATAVKELYQELGTMQAVADLVKKSKGWVSKLVAVAEGLSYWPTKVLEESICEDMEALILLNKIDLLSNGTNRMWSIYEKMKAGGFGRKELQKVLKEIEEPKKETVAVKSNRLPVQPPAVEHARSAALNNVQFRDPESGLTWTGRGKMPEWVKVRLQEGKSLDDLRASKTIDKKEIDSPEVRCIQAEEADEFEELLCRAWTIYRGNPSALEAWIDGAMEIGALGDVFPREEEDKLFFLRQIAAQFFIDERNKESSAAALIREYVEFNGEYAASMPEEDWCDRAKAFIGEWK